jgi:hypothetical protein
MLAKQHFPGNGLDNSLRRPEKSIDNGNSVSGSRTFA